jgi:hypothetical protein
MLIRTCLTRDAAKNPSADLRDVVSEVFAIAEPGLVDVGGPVLAFDGVGKPSVDVDPQRSVTGRRALKYSTPARLLCGSH